ncbi:MAG TPA: hypothetical protein VGP07_23505 [Polyangia bacterium]|jgi:hypothetical protein
MRRLLLALFLSGATLGACSQSLPGKPSGTGGTGAGEGGTGGVTAGGGGAGGISPCASLASAYQSALAAAQDCGLGQSGQCQELMPTALSACGACSTYVNDSSSLSAIRQAWTAAGCAGVAVPCFSDGACPNLVPSLCVAGPEANRGICAASASDAGGAGGSSPDGGASAVCEGLIQKYAAALWNAKSCSPSAADQCGTLVPTELAVCTAGCMAYVNDPTEVNAVRLEWDNAGCAAGGGLGLGGFSGTSQGNGMVSCPVVRCSTAVSGACVAGDAGGTVCSTTYGPISF